MFVMPITTAPVASNRRTHAALRTATAPYAGQPAVVRWPATSMLAFTATVRAPAGTSTSISVMKISDTGEFAGGGPRVALRRERSLLRRAERCDLVAVVGEKPLMVRQSER